MDTSKDIGRRRGKRRLALIAAAIVGMGGIASLLWDTDTAASREEPQLWAGHQVVWGTMDIPFLGQRRTRSETFMLAKVHRDADALRFTQKACAVRFKEVAGARVSIDDESVMALPAVDFGFQIEDGIARAIPWKMGWGRADVDGDGHPGLSIRIDAPLCDGILYVATSTATNATGRPLDDGLTGKIAVRMRQEILGADSICLRLFGRDREENQRGRFAYRRVSSTQTCADLLRKKSWPVRAPSEAPSKKEAP